MRKPVRECSAAENGSKSVGRKFRNAVIENREVARENSAGEKGNNFEGSQTEDL